MIQDPMATILLLAFDFLIILIVVLTGVFRGLGLIVRPLHCDRDHVLVPDGHSHDILNLDERKCDFFVFKSNMYHSKKLRCN